MSKILIRSVIIAFLVIAAWIGIIVGLQMLRDPGYDYRAETQQILEMIRDGKADVVYEQASPVFRETIIEDRWDQLTHDMNRTLGGFQEIVSTVRAETIDAPSGKTGRLDARLRFENGETRGSFSYHWIDGEPRLLGFTVELPEEVAGEVNPETWEARYEAPAEVLERGRQVLAAIRDGDGAAVYDEAAEPFKESKTREEWLAMLERHRRALGPYIRVLDVTASAKNRRQSYSNVVFVCEYAEAVTTVSLTFLRDGDAWRLVTYKVVIPAPNVPDLSTDPEATDPEPD